MSVMNNTKHVPDAELYPELQGDDSTFTASTIRDEDSSIALEILIGSYTEPVVAVIRELLANAVDSQRSAHQHETGPSEPVKLTLPTAEHPELIVEDSGLGLSATEMVAVFTRPAASTKRGDDSVTGELGIGAKAPFTVTDRFVVTAVKDQVRSTLIMARINGRLMHKVSSVEDATGQPNGVKVTVPVDPASTEQWHDAATKVLFWFDQDLIELTNEDETKRSFPNWREAALPVDPMLASTKIRPSISNVSMVRMDQIGYEIPERLRIELGMKLLFMLDAKELDVAPTREAILDTQENLDKLIILRDEWLDGWKKPLLEELYDPTMSMVEYALRYRKLNMRSIFLGNEVPADKPHKETTIAHYARLIRPSNIITTVDKLTEEEEIAKCKTLVHSQSNKVAAEFYDPISALSNTAGDLIDHVLFVDREALSQNMQRKLSGWAKKQRQLVISVDKHHWEGLMMKQNLSNTESITRPAFGESELIEWVDPEIIKQSMKSPRREKAAPTTVSTPMKVIVKVRPNKNYYGYQKLSRERFATSTVGEVLDQLKSNRSSVLVQGTLAEIDEHLGQADFSVDGMIVVSTKERALEYVLGEAPKARVLTPEEYSKQRFTLGLRRMTPAVRSDMADIAMLSLVIRDVVRYLDFAPFETNKKNQRQAVERIRASLLQADLHPRLSPKAVAFLERASQEAASVTERLMRKYAARESLTKAVYSLGNLTRAIKNSAWAERNSRLGDLVPLLRSVHMLGRIERESRWVGENEFERSTYDASALLVQAIEAIVKG